MFPLNFLNKINGLSIASVSPKYKLLKKACKEYDDQVRDPDDSEEDALCLPDYSPNNEYFQAIIKIMQDLSKCHFGLNFLGGLIIR